MLATAARRDVTVVVAVVVGILHALQSTAQKSLPVRMRIGSHTRAQTGADHLPSLTTTHLSEHRK